MQTTRQQPPSRQVVLRPPRRAAVRPPRDHRSRYRGVVCGIAGRAGPAAGHPEHIRRMTGTLWHRGPDDDGFFVDRGIELGMRRLAVIDVAHGQQPATNETGEVQVVLNGEIYNFMELRERLVSLGHDFSSMSDTEVVAHAYEQWGMSSLQHLQGMFAIAIWDARSQELILVRDRLGKKPLLFAPTNDGGLIFASEARAILAAGWISRPDFSALNHVLAFGYVPTNGSAFSGIESLPPANTLVWRAGRYDIQRYWSVDWRSPQPMRVDAAIEGAHHEVRLAVERRLVSERPLGVFLSGGIDSTVVAAIAQESHTDSISTFTASFADARFNEAHHAARVAEHLGTDHHTLEIDPDPHLVGDQLPVIFDQPFADSSAVPTYLLSKYARESIVVALGGDGGDETFTGYDRYIATPRLQRWNGVLAAASPLSGTVARIASSSGDKRLQRVARSLHGYASLGDRYRALMTLAGLDARRRLWASDTIPEHSAAAPEVAFTQLWDTVPVDAPIDRMVATDLASYLPGDLLVKADIASMANSLELRSPLLDERLLEYTARIPWDVRVHRGTSKFLLKRIAERYVPADILDRPKMGFGIPRARWLRGEMSELVHDTLLGATAQQRGWFDRQEVATLLQQHSGGSDRDSILWPMLMIELWAQRWID